MTTEVKVKNVAINLCACKVSLIDNKITLEKQGYKGSWAVLSNKQLTHDDIEDAVTKNWIELSDTAPTFTKEVKTNFIIVKPPAYGSATPEEAIARNKAEAKEDKPVKVKKKKTGAKVSKLTMDEALKLG